MASGAIRVGRSADNCSRDVVGNFSNRTIYPLASVRAIVAAIAAPDEPGVPHRILGDAIYRYCGSGARTEIDGSRPIIYRVALITSGCPCRVDV